MKTAFKNNKKLMTQPSAASLSFQKTPIYVSFLIFSTVMLLVGFHNIDNAWNMNYVECVTGTTFTDSNMFGTAGEKNQLYTTGWLEIFIGFVTLCYMSIIYNLSDNNKRCKKEVIQR